MSRRNLLVAVVAAVAVLLVGGAIAFTVLGDDPVDDPAIEGLQVFEDLPTTHVEGEVDYEETPPVGGEHFAAWLDCGVYDVPIPEELAVHDLEHGSIWFTYDAAELDAGEVATLAERLPDNGIMSPYEGLDTPLVVSAWERQVALDGIDDPRLDQFLDAYEGGPTAPEASVTCAGGASLDDLAALGAPAA